MSKTIRTSNNLTIDATGDIILDADNADVKLQDGGTEFGRISRVTSDLVIKSMGDNNDILLKGLDGGSTITALQLDMSENGNAIFSGDITATDITANSLTTNVISSNGSNAGISIQPSGSGEVLLGALRLNGTTLDTNDSSAITIGEEINFEGAVNLSGGDLITGNNRISFNDQSSGTVSFLDFTVTQFSQTNNTVLSSVKSINFFLDSNGGDSGQAFRIYNNTNPDSSPTENTYIFKVDESGNLFVTGDTTMTGDLTVTDITANSLTTNVISSNGSNADISIQPSGTGDVLLSAVRVNGTTLDSSDSTKITIAEDVDVTGVLTASGTIHGVQNLTGSGSTEVINLTDTVTLLTTTGAQAFSLANGTEGQIKIISMKVDGGDATVTPATFVNGTSITFDSVNDTMTLLYQSTGWVVLAQQNTTVNA